MCSQTTKISGFHRYLTSLLHLVDSMIRIGSISRPTSRKPEAVIVRSRQMVCLKALRQKRYGAFGAEEPRDPCRDTHLLLLRDSAHWVADWGILERTIWSNATLSFMQSGRSLVCSLLKTLTAKTSSPGVQIVSPTHHRCTNCRPHRIALNVGQDALNWSSPIL